MKTIYSRAIAGTLSLLGIVLFLAGVAATAVGPVSLAAARALFNSDSEAAASAAALTALTVASFGFLLAIPASFRFFRPPAPSSGSEEDMSGLP